MMERKNPGPKPTRLTRQCEICSKDFLARKRDVDAGKAKFCSKACWVAHKRTSNALVLRTCATCGKEFQLYQSQANASRRFCSNECSGLFQRSRVTCECKHCGSDFETIPSKANGKKRAKFCSRECSSKGQKHNQGPPPKRVVCQACGKVFIETLGRERKYCSNKCCTDSLRKPDSQKAEKRGKEHAKWALKVLRRDRRCVRCGTTKDLQAHHIEHWKTHPDKRYDTDNGATLCMYCHHAQHPNIPLSKFTELGGVSVRYCVVCESAFVARKKDQRACGRKCWARLNADGRLRRAAMQRRPA